MLLAGAPDADAGSSRGDPKWSPVPSVTSAGDHFGSPLLPVGYDHATQGRLRCLVAPRSGGHQLWSAAARGRFGRARRVARGTMQPIGWLPIRCLDGESGDRHAVAAVREWARRARETGRFLRAGVGGGMPDPLRRLLAERRAGGGRRGASRAVADHACSIGKESPIAGLAYGLGSRRHGEVIGG